MKRLAIISPLCLCVALTSFAGSKPAMDYQDAVLVEFRDAVTGSDCASNGDIQLQSADGQTATGTASVHTACSNSRSRQYTLQVGEHIYVVEQKLSAKQAPLLVSPVGLLFIHKSVLADQAPGSHVRVRTDGHGFYVRVGKKESAFEVVSAK